MPRILLPVDGSECSKKTAEYVGKLFPSPDFDFIVLNVISINQGVRLNHQAYENIATEVLDDIKNILTGSGHPSVRAEYRYGDPVKTICEFADTEDVDKIIMGTHGHTGLKKFILGSVAEGILEHANKPVLIYKNIC